MRAILLIGFLLTASSGMVSCASSAMLPKNAAEVKFDAPEGKTGWSSYAESCYFPDTTRAQVYAAAKAGIGSADFSLRRADIDAGVVIGEHGMTMHDWNIVAGVYFAKRDGGFDVRVFAEGSKDIGFSGDATSGGWTGRILQGMRNFLQR